MPDRKTAMLVYGMGDDSLEVDRIRNAMNAFAAYFPGQGGQGRALLWLVRNRRNVHLTMLPPPLTGTGAQYSVRLESPQMADFVHTGLHLWAKQLGLYAGGVRTQKVSIGMLLRAIANHESDITALLAATLGAALAAQRKESHLYRNV